MKSIHIDPPYNTGNEGWVYNDKHRGAGEATASERALFPQSGLEFETSSDVQLIFDEGVYAYNKPNKGGTEFKKHLFRVVRSAARILIAQSILNVRN